MTWQRLFRVWLFALVLFAAGLEPQRSEACPAGQYHYVVYPACNIPEPTSRELVIVLNAYRGHGLSTHALGSIDNLTEVQDVEVRNGGGHYYIAIRNSGSLIWRFTGNVSAISRVVVLGSELGRGHTGVVGVPQERITFVASEDLTNSVPKTSCGGPSKACIADEYFTGPNLQTGMNGWDNTKLLQRQRWQARAIEVNSRVPTYIPMDRSDYEVELAKSSSMPRPEYSSGVVSIDPLAVVAEDILVAYPLLPKDAGIAQLISAGTLHPKGSQVYREVYQRWNEALSKRFANQFDPSFRFSLDVDYVVTGNMTLPLGLGGQRFLVAANVTSFGGKLGYRSCVFFEDGRSDDLGCVNLPKSKPIFRDIGRGTRD